MSSSFVLLDDLPQKLALLTPVQQKNLVEQAIAAKVLPEEALAHLGALDTLSLRSSQVGDRGLGFVGLRCGSSLIDIDLSYCTRLRDAGVIAFSRLCPQLRRLVLSHCRLTDAAFECVARSCRQLRDLDCSWNGSGFSERSVRAFAANLPHLQALAICGCRLEDGALLALACACPKLATLNTRGCEMLTETGIVGALCMLPKISTLKLSQIPRISEQSVSQLTSRARQVTRLDLSMCSKLGDEAITRAAAGFPMLQVLECYGLGRLQAPTITAPLLTTLVLSGCRALVNPTITCPRLEELELHSCKELQPDVLTRVCAASPALRRLDLSGCSRLEALQLDTAPALLDVILDGCTRLTQVRTPCMQIPKCMLIPKCMRARVLLHMHRTHASAPTHPLTCSLTRSLTLPFPSLVCVPAV